MKMKKSNYNIIVDKLEDNLTLIYNTFTSTFGSMDTNAQHLYENIDNISFENLKDEESINNFLAMKELGFIVESSYDDKNKLDLLGQLSRFNFSNLNLIIAPTLLCNMKCPYCFETEQNSKMSTETCDKLLKFIEDNIPALKTLKITWYGGEPLLALDIITSLSERIIELCKLHNVNYIAHIITNGVLLDTDTAILLRDKCNVSNAQITIDGLNDLHNSRRILKNVLDSFNIITKNIDDIKDILKITIRSNVDKDNYYEYINLVKFFVLDKKWSEKVFFYFNLIDLKSQKDTNYNDKICFKSKDFSSAKIALLREISEFIPYELLLTYLPQFHNTPCGATKYSTLCIAPLGYLYKCALSVGDVKKSIGSLNTENPLFSSSHQIWLEKKAPKECEPCEYLPLCQGGCPLKRESLIDSHEYCLKKSFDMKQFLKLYYELYVSSCS